MGQVGCYSAQQNGNRLSKASHYFRQSRSLNPEGAIDSLDEIRAATGYGRIMATWHASTCRATIRNLHETIFRRPSYAINA